MPNLASCAATRTSQAAATSRPPPRHQPGIRAITGAGIGGEYAASRELLTSLPFAPGYGVEIGLLVDTFDRLGLDAIAQVNLGVRAHRNRPLAELGAMSRQVIATLLSRCGIPDSGVGLTQFVADGGDGYGYRQHTCPVSLADRPPMGVLRPC